MVSIIVPVYNAAKYIATTIEMVRSQTYTDWELILIDDHSSDNSVAIIKSSVKKSESESGKIRLIEKPQNQGAAAARNTGIDNVKGRYIAFLDADDVWYRDKLERQMAFMVKHEAAFTFTGYEFGDEGANPNGKVCHVPKTLTYSEALSRTIIFTSTVLLDTKKIRKDLIYMPIIGSEDTATWWQILKSGVTAYGLDEPLAIYRRPPKSLSSDKKVAIKRIWNLYRTTEGMSKLKATLYMFKWAWRATVRRVVADTIRNHIEAIKRVFVWEIALIGILIQTAFYSWVWFNRYYPVISGFRVSQEGIDLGAGLKLYFRGHLLVLAMYFLLLLFLTKQNEGTKTGYMKPGSIFTSQITAILIANIMIYFQMSLMGNWLMPLRYLALLTIFQMAFAAVWAIVSDRIYRAVFSPIETLVITSQDTGKIVKAFSTRSDRFEIMRTINIGDTNVDIKQECLRWYGAVVIDTMEETKRNDLLEYCYAHHIRVYYLPDIPDILVHGSEPADLFKIPVMELKEYSISWESGLVKRITDIILSGILIIISSPVMLARAIYGKIIYGKVLDRRICATKKNRKFTLHSFYKDGNLPKKRIDRLPMLLDVFGGKMSMVGPSPMGAEEIEKLIEKDPRYEYRQRVKAGITGNAQIYARAKADSEDRLKFDLMYIQHYSIMLDLKLIMSSVRTRRKEV
jgi:glycosyltransferase involved in cell wall biosynthesis/lipopolysaccharide/colanic/teichoic acid biosynthesis glycosyltransferase